MRRLKLKWEQGGRYARLPDGRGAAFQTEHVRDDGSWSTPLIYGLDGYIAAVSFKGFGSPSRFDESGGTPAAARATVERWAWEEFPESRPGRGA